MCRRVTLNTRIRGIVPLCVVQQTQRVLAITSRNNIRPRSNPTHLITFEWSPRDTLPGQAALKAAEQSSVGIIFSDVSAAGRSQRQLSRFRPRFAFVV